MSAGLCSHSEAQLGKNSIPSSFRLLAEFISFSSRKLNGSGKSGQPCLVPELRAVVHISPPSFILPDPFYQIKEVHFHS